MHIARKLSVLLFLLAPAALANPTMQLLLAGAGAVVNLDGHTNVALNFGADATAWFQINQDGLVYEKDNSGSWSQIDATADWVRPTFLAPGDYEARYVNATGDTTDVTASATMNIWYSLSGSDYTISILDTTTGPGGKSVTFDFEIRLDGDTLASTSYTLSADREDV